VSLIFLVGIFSLDLIQVVFHVCLTKGKKDKEKKEDTTTTSSSEDDDYHRVNETS
jgi:formiminotetrahydrofolate cyclodeaminase